MPFFTLSDMLNETALNRSNECFSCEYAKWLSAWIVLIGVH